MTEDFVKKSIIAWLKKKNYKISRTTYQLFGVAIKAYHRSGEEYIVECAVETRMCHNPLDFCGVLGRLILRMNRCPALKKHYAAGLPDTEHFRRQFNKYKKLPRKIQKFLKIRFLFVNSKGEVKKYTWKD